VNKAEKKINDVLANLCLAVLQKVIVIIKECMMLKKMMGMMVFAMLASMVFATKDDKLTVVAHVVGDRIVVTYNFPKGVHQSFNKDLFGFEIAPVKGIEFGETVYPKVKKKGKEDIIFHGKTELSRSFKITGKPATKELKITASYQVCLDSGMCSMPQDIDITLTLP
jgi:hypothetical protein